MSSLLAAALPIVALGSLVMVSGVIVLAAVTAGAFAFDFLAYHQAAQRVLAGERLYDPSVLQTGGFGLFYYPPPFVFAALPLGLLPETTAAWVWLGLSVAFLLAAIAAMPVRSTARWVTLLLAGLSWPVAYALKLGQVGPLLLLVFALGWRWLDRPVVVGVAGVAGAVVKIQPGLILVWALLTRRLRAVVIGGVLGIVVAVVTTALLGGPQVWFDYVALLRNVSDPITTPHNFTPGAAVYQLGVSASVATIVQVVSSVLVVALLIVAALRASASSSYLATVVASQLLSPVLWDHYAMLLLLPVAWLLGRRQWWAVVIPLATSAPMLLVDLPALIYPILFWATLIGVVLVGIREGRSDPARTPA